MQSLHGGSEFAVARMRWAVAIRSCLPALTVIMLLAIFFVLGAEAVAQAPTIRVSSVAASLLFSGFSMVVFLVGGLLMLARARIGDEAMWVPLGFGAICYGFGVVGVGEILPQVLDSPVVGASRAVLLSVTVLVFSDSIHSGVARGWTRRLTAVYGGCLSAIALLAGLLAHSFTVAIALVALSAAFGLAGHLTRKQPLIWFGVVLVGLALAELALGATSGQEIVWSITASAVRLVALLSALAALASHVFHEYWGSVNDMAEVSASVRRLEAQAIEAAQASAERRHEASSALAAIELGLAAIGRQSGADDPASIRDAMATELSMLRHIVATEAGDANQTISGEYSVSRVVADVVAAQRWAGMRVTTDVRDHLIAIGRRSATAEALQVLLDNARTHAANSDVRVSARGVGSEIEIVVQDNGHGVPPKLAQSVFDRGVSSRNGGLGLFIARRLIEMEGGAITLDLSGDAGAAFVVSLPAAQPASEVDEIPGTVESHQLVSLADLHHSNERSWSMLHQSDQRTGNHG
ncbi:MAG: HAMP domain-containing histidine kinase [Acidimicrobiia bacterium]|nr:HAMP domain-containing histidine kinase [Acidimicrobiia bacterium]